MRQEPISFGIYQRILSESQAFLRDTALLYFGRNITYRGMLTQTERCARAFLRWGVRTGDHVLLCSTITPELVYCLLALWKLGAVAHLLNPTFSQEEQALCIKRSEASLLLVLDQWLPSIQSVAKENDQLQTIVIPATQSMPFLVRRAMGKKLPVKSVDSDRPRCLMWKEFLESGQSIYSSPATIVSEQQTAAVVYPSQSPKGQSGICLTHGGVCSMIDLYEQNGFSWKRQEKFLDSIPPWYATGITATLLVPLSFGLTVILEPRLQANAFTSTLVRERPEHVSGCRSFWLHTIKHPQLREEDLSFIHTAYTISETELLSREEEAALNVFLLSHNSPTKIHKAYVCSKLGGTVSCTLEGCNRSGSVGAPLPSVKIKICDASSGAMLEPDCEGEIWVSSPCCMQGYFKNPEETAESIREDEVGVLWCHTGRQGYLSEDGSLYISEGIE